MRLSKAATTLLVVAINVGAASGSAHAGESEVTNQAALLRGSNAAIVADETKAVDKIRELASLINMRENPFVLAGIPLLPDVAQENCPSEWTAFTTCTITTCSNAVAACPSSAFYQNTSSSTPISDAVKQDFTCFDLEESFCYNFGVDGCCMVGCRARMLEIVKCLTSSLGGKKLECDEWTTCQDILAPSSSPSSVPTITPTATPTTATPTATPTISPAPTASPTVSPTLPVPPCVNENGRLSCEYRTSYTSPKGKVTRVNAVVQCPIEIDVLGFEVPETDCHCEATLKSGSGPDKICRCSVCDLMSGQPVSVDCRNNFKDPFIAEDCTALSCNSECSDSGRFQVKLVADRTALTSLNRTDVSTGFFPQNFVPALGKLFFHGFSKDTGYELWVTDGTLKGTRAVKDINPGVRKSVNENGRDFQLRSAELNGKLLFFANDGVNGKELWSTSGTEKDTQMVKDLVVGEGDSSLRGSFVKYGGKLYFTTMQEDRPDLLWMTNGTSEGTRPVGDDSIFTPASEIKSLVEKTTFDGRSYFISKPSNGSDVFLYASNGTKEDTVVVSKIPGVSGEQELVEFKNKLYFNSRSLWTTDGTEQGTGEMIDSTGTDFASPESMVVVNDLLYFFSGCNLFSSDGNSEGYLKLLEQPGSSSCPSELAKLGSKVLLRSGGQPYVSDGTMEGTVRLVDANLTSSTSFVVYNNQVAFFAATSKSNSFGHGHDLWVTDGTPENTFVIPDIGINQVGLFPHFDNLFVFKNAVYMTVWYLFEPGDELWKVEIPVDVAGLFESLSWNAGAQMMTETTSDISSEVTLVVSNETSPDNSTSAVPLSTSPLKT